MVIASARPPRSVRHIYQSLALDTWQINYNGALVWDEPNSAAVFHQPMPGTLVRRIIDQARHIDDRVLVTCEILDRWYTDRFDNTFTTETGRLYKPDVVAAIDTFCDREITKLLLLGDEQLILRVEASLAALFDGQIAMMRSDPNLIQIMHPRVSKAVALRRVAEHYGVPLEQVMAIGDAVNDVPMLQAAGIGVAMDNAPAAVKQAADWVAPSNNDHGVYAALRRYGLCD